MTGVLAFDIGGANLKLADGRGYACSRSFALWKQPAQLPAQLSAMLSEAPRADQLAVTMTGELADCFPNKSAGVQAIVRSAVEAADQRPVRFYLTDGRLVDAEEAQRQPRLAAASNWHALGRYAAELAAQQGPALLVDVGSTTCDLVPLLDGRLIARGTTDTERLLAGELVYTGIHRSPLCALLRTTPYRGRDVAVAQELFATALDAYLVVGKLPEQPECCETADGRPATRAAAQARMARMLAAWEDEFTEQDARAMARAVIDQQVRMIAAALHQVVQRMPAPPQRVILAGQGDFLGRHVVEQQGWDAEFIMLSRQLGPTVSRCATAHALAVLAGGL